MRRRLTVAVLGVVVGTLVLTVAGSLLLVRRAAVSTAQTELVSEVEALGGLVSSSPAATDARVVKLLRRVGGFDLAFAGLTQRGTFVSLPAPLVPGVMNSPALERDRTVTGSVGRVVFAAVPVGLTDNQRTRLAPRLTVNDLPVLVATRSVPNQFNGVAYFFLVGGVVLVVGAAVAAVLARRISSPLVRAVQATREIADGNLRATVPVSRHDPPELTELAEAINAMGEHLSRAQGLERQFLMSVSHDLRTPLTSIRGYADAIAEGATDDVAGAVGIIATEARRLERLVQDLLDLARLDARQFSLHPQRIDSADVVEAVVDGFRPAAMSEGVELATSDDVDRGLWVDADPDRVGQIVANLVENALKFASTRVEVGAGAVGAWTGVWVVDDGPGIGAEDLPRIFERHFRSDRVSARTIGSGLGLAIVAELAAAMGAVVRAESPVSAGRGARMVVWMATRPDPASPGPEKPPPPPGVPDGGGGQHSV